MSAKRKVKKVVDELPSFLLDGSNEQDSHAHWFVYLFASADCSTFKVGFSCNPLQRICTFNRRYFECFNLTQSLLARVNSCEAARALEAMLKAQFDAYKLDVPSWVSMEAGGHTEWFSAVHFLAAESRLRSLEHVQIETAFDYFRSQLERACKNFEPWAWMQAQRAIEARSAAERGYSVKDLSVGLRDWLDAFQYFDLPLFVDDPEVRRFVLESTRLQYFK